MVTVAGVAGFYRRESTPDQGFRHDWGRKSYRAPDDRSSMSIFAVILALVAVVLFAADYMKGKSFVSLGLAALTISWMCQLIVATGSRVTVN
jgi:hypothetical protein